MDAERGETKPCPKCGESKPRNGYRYCDACVDAALSDTEGGLMGDLLLVVVIFFALLILLVGNA